MNHALLAVISFISCAGLLKILIHILKNFSVVDAPEERRIHKTVTPRGGGLAIVLVLICCVAAYSSDYSAKLVPILLVLSGVCMVDDIKSLPISIRLFTHIFCAGLAIFCFLYPNSLFHSGLPLYADLLLGTICFAGFLNIYNFMDGIDGITAMETIHLSVTLLLICYLKHDIIISVDLVILIATVLCSCSLAFLIFNWSPAQIFIGDVGSITLGFSIGLCLILVAASSERLFAASVISSLYYLADSVITIVLRLANGEKIWEPHLKHFFQIAVRSGKSHKDVVLIITKCNLALMCLAILSLYWPVLAIMLAIFTVMITLSYLARCKK